MYDNFETNQKKKRGNTFLVIFLTSLFTILIVAVIFLSLIITGDIQIDGISQPIIEWIRPSETPYVINSTPQVWSYDEDDVEDFVEDALEAFVYGINTGNSNYINIYFSGDAAKDELASHKSISAIVQQEILHEVECHSVTRISPSQVTVIRDSLIEVIYNDGTSKNIPERYQYTVDISGKDMKIVGLKSLK